MYLTVKQQLKHLTKDDYTTLKELSHIAKNLTNQAIYNVRQHYFDTGEYLNYNENYKLLKNSQNYKTLNSNMAQQIIKQVDRNFKSFFALLRKANNGEYPRGACRIPNYLDKHSHTTLIIGDVRITKNNTLIIPFSSAYKKDHKNISIKVPPILHDKRIKEIRIIPMNNARFFEIQYTYEANTTTNRTNNTKSRDFRREQQQHQYHQGLDTHKALAIDLGVDNLVTAVTSTGESFIIDGRKLKSINQWYNKENARLQKIKAKQGIKYTTNRQKLLSRKRRNRVDDYLSKAARFVVDYCVAHGVGVLVLGYNEGFQNKSDLGSRNNQNFVMIPFGRLKAKLAYLCELVGVRFVIQEESYTSKASFWDKDAMPVYKKKGSIAGDQCGGSGSGGEDGSAGSAGNSSVFSFCSSGCRVFRGLFCSSDGRLLNADVNGALNILRKSNVVSLEALYTRGVVDTPARIKIT